jgi:hypothetical protein
MIHAIWDDEAPPDFLWEYQAEIMRYTQRGEIAEPIDEMSFIVLDFAVLRAKIRYKQVGDVQGAEQAAELERRIIEWFIETPKQDERWKCYEIEVEDSPHVWGNMLHS